MFHVSLFRSAPNYRRGVAAEKPLSFHVSKKSGDFRGDFYDRIEKDHPVLAVSEPESSGVDREQGAIPKSSSLPSSEVSADDIEEVVSSGQLKIIGQLLNTYILCEGENSLVVIDQVHSLPPQKIGIEEMDKDCPPVPMVEPARI